VKIKILVMRCLKKKFHWAFWTLVCTRPWILLKLISDLPNSPFAATSTPPTFWASISRERPNYFARHVLPLMLTPILILGFSLLIRLILMPETIFLHSDLSLKPRLARRSLKMACRRWCIPYNLSHKTIP
jgi:hypothetical protein